MKLGIIGAMTVEVESLKKYMQDIRITERAHMTFYEGKIENIPVVVVVCGVGKVNAALCVQLLCDCFKVTHVINTGVAGSLHTDLDIADFVISTDAMYHDFDCHVLNPKYKIGQVPGLSVHAFPADKFLIECAFSAAEQVYAGHTRLGTIASGDQFVCNKEQKHRIIENTNALCTEMEGAAIAHSAWCNDVPFVVIRAISDKADDSAQMDYPTFEAIAAERCVAVIRQMTKNIGERT